MQLLNELQRWVGYTNKLPDVLNQLRIGCQLIKASADYVFAREAYERTKAVVYK